MVKEAIDNAFGAVPEWELAFRFEAGLLPLAFTATVGERWRRCFERLTSPDRWGQWIVQAGLATNPPAPSLRNLNEACELREAIYRVVRASISNQPFPQEDIAVINMWASEPPIALEMTSEGKRKLSQGADLPDRVLAELARQAIELVTDSDAIVRVRECAAPDCALLFYDASRPGHRRWCSDGACGTRNRARRRRAKTKG